jgi:hypothetical protein
MNSPAHDLAQYLISQGHGTVTANEGWAISVSLEPALPKNVVTLYDTGGAEPDTDQLNLYRPTVQVRTRSRYDPEGWNKQDGIRSLFHAVSGLVLGDTRYAGITAETDIAHIGNTDGDELYLFTCNYRVLREPV